MKPKALLLSSSFFVLGGVLPKKDTPRYDHNIYIYIYIYISIIPEAPGAFNGRLDLSIRHPGGGWGSRSQVKALNQSGASGICMYTFPWQVKRDEELLKELLRSRSFALLPDPLPNVSMARRATKAGQGAMGIGGGESTIGTQNGTVVNGNKDTICGPLVVQC